MTAHTPPHSTAQGSTAPRARKTVKEGFVAGLVEPLDRLIEGIYSVLIVLTFTLATRAVQVQSGEVADRFDLLFQLFIAALGCAVAWGLIDGAMYVLTCVFERGKDRRLYRLVRDAASEEDGIAVLADELDDDMGSLATSAERREIYKTLYARLRTSPPPPGGFEKGDFGGGFGVFLVAVGAALPIVLPLILLPGSIQFRLRVSNLVAFAMLFGMGYRWGRYAGGKPLLTGLMLLILGVIMVVVAIPLGG
jgi:hypothetical protein